MLTRRDFMKTLGGAAVLSAFPGCASDPNRMRASKPRSKPNILFILADDLGWADVGYHGSEIHTPNIDLLASEGARLECAYVAPTCSPTRTSLLTGLFASRLGVVGPTNERVFEPGATTLATALQESGYRTALCGKWHLGSSPEWGPNENGFQHAYGSLAGGVHPYSHRYKKGPYSRTWHRNGELIDEEGHVTDLIGREAVSYIETAAQSPEPFFLYVPFTAVHIPIIEPEQWTAPYEGVIENEPRRRYAACATHMDHWIGELVSALERSGQRENTIIVFASDNGGQHRWDNVGEYPDTEPSAASPVLGNNRPWRGWKGGLHEGGIRVPMVVSLPVVIQSQTIGAPVHIADWMPTLCRLAGCEPEADAPLDGQDMWPLLMGETPAERTLYWRTLHAEAVRKGNYKLIRQSNSGAIELYDLEADPDESRDLTSEKPDVATKLAELLDQHRMLDAEEIIPFMRPL